MPPLPAIAGVQSITGAVAPARTAAMRRSISAGRRCWGSGAGAGRIRFLGRRLGRAAPGRAVRRPKGAAGIIIRAATRVLINRPQARRRQLEQMPVGIAEIDAVAAARPIGAAFDGDALLAQSLFPLWQFV